jgi:hypothetical protein
MLRLTMKACWGGSLLLLTGMLPLGYCANTTTDGSSTQTVLYVSVIIAQASSFYYCYYHWC